MFCKAKAGVENGRKREHIPTGKKIKGADKIMAERSMLKKAEQTMLSCGMTDIGSVLVGLSGGADSVALLSVLCVLSEKYGFSVSAAHINHCLRGETAERDEAFSRAAAERAGAPFYLLRADVRDRAAEKGISEELAGREIRYEFFEKICAEKGIDAIATAHHRNDNAETILMNFMRGSSISGLCGIPYRRGKIIRPLLDVTRAEIERYCKDNSLEYVIDETNLETEYTRNKIRNILIPQIEQLFNPGFVQTVTRNAPVIAADEDYIRGEARREYERLGNDGIETAKFNTLHRALRSRIIRMAIEPLCSTSDVPSAVIDSVIELAEENRTGSRCDIARGIAARIEYGKLRFGAVKTENNGFSYRIRIGEKIYVPELKAEIVVEYAEGKEADGAEYFSAENIENSVIELRSRRTGDSFCPTGMRGTKKLKDYMIDEKIPRQQRDLVGLLTIDGKIAWVIGKRRDRRFKFTDHGIKISILY